MNSLEEACDDVLAAYDDCVDAYIMLSQRRTRLRFKNLAYAYADFCYFMNNFMAILYAENIPEDETWLMSKWWHEDYFHDCDLYICPADMLADVAAVLKE